MSYEIKKLEWEYSKAAWGWLADGIDARYKISEPNNYLLHGGKNLGLHTTLEEAKAAAQEYYENEVKKHLVEVE